MDKYTPECESPLVLVIDDDPSLRRSLARLLRSAGLEVETFARAAELLAFERPPRPSCLVLDLHLPDMDGYELLRKIVAEAPDLPVIILTGETGEQKRLRALQDGAEAFLTKPFEDDRLLDEIHRLLAR
ncbi:MAG TPA: response regulator [Solirubrobacterales bacterium]